MSARWVIAAAVVVTAAGAAFWVVRSMDSGSSSTTSPPSRPSESPRRPPPPRPPETIDELIAQLASAETRGHAQLKLQERGAEALPAIAQALTSGGAAREVLLNLLTASRDKRWLPAVLTLFERTDEESQALAIKGVSRLDATEEKARLVHIAADPVAPPQLRLLAADVLASWKASEALPTILSWMPPPNETAAQRASLDRWQRRLRSKAVELLGDLGSAEAVEPLRAVLLGPDELLYSDAAESLAKIGGTGLDALQAALETHERSRVYNVLRGLARSSDPRAADLLKPYLSDPNELLKKAANDSMRRLANAKKG